MSLEQMGECCPDCMTLRRVYLRELAELAVKSEGVCARMGTDRNGWLEGTLENRTRQAAEHLRVARDELLANMNVTCTHYARR